MGGEEKQIKKDKGNLENVPVLGQKFHKFYFFKKNKIDKIFDLGW